MSTWSRVCVVGVMTLTSGHLYAQNSIPSDWIDPDTGHTMDHIRPHIDGFAWLKPEEREMIYNGNARKVFKLKV